MAYIIYQTLHVSTLHVLMISDNCRKHVLTNTQNVSMISSLNKTSAGGKTLEKICNNHIIYALRKTKTSKDARIIRKNTQTVTV